VQHSQRTVSQAFLLTILTVIYLYLFIRVLWRVGDEGTLLQGAQLVAEGALPYRDFFDVMGPASFYWLGLFFKLFGIHIWVARGLLLVTGLAMVLLIYWMTLRVYRGSFEMLPALMYMVLAIPTWPATNHHWDSNLFALLALGAFFLWQDKRAWFYLVLAGVLAGITTCFIQHKGLLVFLGLLLGLEVNDWRAGEAPRRRLTHLGLALGGYAAVGVLVLVLFFLAGGLPDLIYANLIWPLTNYQNVNVVSYGYGLCELIYRMGWEPRLGVLLPTWAVFPFGAFLLGPFLIILILPLLLLILTTASYFLSSNRPRLFNALLLPYWSVGLGLWLSELHRKDIIHLIYGSPVLLILLLVAWNNCCSHREVVRKLALGLVSLSLLVYGAAHVLEPLAAQQKIVTRRGTLYAFQADDVLNFLQEQIKPKEEVFIYPYYPMYYFLADVKNPTRYSILIYNYNSRNQFKEVIRNIKEKKVKYILWDTLIEGINLQLFFPAYKNPSEKDMILENFIKMHYSFIGIKNRFRVMVRRDLGKNNDGLTSIQTFQQ
jgi:4-amino-4-deoxy-L-arabinose transferase-like glycosyltransferase